MVTARRAALALPLALVAGGCLRSTTYTCTTDRECELAAGGACEDNGYCSVPDGACASGRRFGAGAGPYADTCVVDDPVDAAIADAPTDARADARTDAAVDATIDATTTVGCTSPGNATSFPPGPPCAGWGTSFANNASVQNSGGRLLITPVPAEAAATAGCTHTTVPFGVDGVLVEVSQVLAGTSSRTRLELSGTGLSIGVEGGQMVARAGGATRASVPFAAATMRWWRMRPIGGGIGFETAADGLHWTTLATAAGPPPATAPIRIVGDTPSAEPAPGAARIEGLNLCP